MASDPRRDVLARPFGEAVLPSARLTASAPVITISWLNPRACLLSVYASGVSFGNMYLLAPATLDSGCWPALPGGDQTRRVVVKGFRVDL
jgi:hypothetical protein